MTEKIGQRGKSAEKIVEGVLKSWNTSASFAYFRLADARAARNFLAAQPGDFAYFSGTFAGIIEVKSSQHSYRIAKDKISQLPVLQKLAYAGAKSVILIHHTTENVWRAVHPLDLTIGLPSWDLSHLPTYTSAEAALKSTGWF